MSGKPSKAKQQQSSIAQNRKARHEFTIEDTFEAGLVLEGWEVKSARAGKVQLSDAYVQFKNGEAFLFGALINPLPSASTHVTPEPGRYRKLLMHRVELDRMMGAIERKGMTAVALAIYWKSGHIKAQIGLARGKKQHDKRASEKDRDWSREKGRILKGGR